MWQKTCPKIRIKQYLTRIHWCRSNFYDMLMSMIIIITQILYTDEPRSIQYQCALQTFSPITREMITFIQKNHSLHQPIQNSPINAFCKKLVCREKWKMQLQKELKALSKFTSSAIWSILHLNSDVLQSLALKSFGLSFGKCSILLSLKGCRLMGDAVLEPTVWITDVLLGDEPSSKIIHRSTNTTSYSTKRAALQ